MNWKSPRPGEGFEYHILGLEIGLALLFYGGGNLFIDRCGIQKGNTVIRDFNPCDALLPLPISSV